MRRRIVKPLSIVLSAVIIAGSVCTGLTYAMADEKNIAITADETPAVSTVDEEQKKSETVYAFTGADGTVNNVIVSDWLKENAGEDVYSTENGESELPITLAVTYTLDGAEISPEELAGKSGKVTIHFEYIDNEYVMSDISGNQEKINVPFAVLTGVLLDNDVFSNVEVTGGKLINDGDRSFVAGMAFAGLQDNLAIDSEKLEIPDSLTITADVVNFEMSNTFTIATSDVFGNIDLDDAEDYSDKLSDVLTEMTDAMTQLMDGSSQLYEGLCTLFDKSGELADGVTRLEEGAAALNEGAVALSSGAAAINSGAAELNGGAAALSAGAGELSQGANTLAGGLNTLAANNDTLNGGAYQVFQSLLGIANSQIAAAGISAPALTIENYAEVLGSITGSLNQESVLAQATEVARQTVTAKVNEQRDAIRMAVAAQVQAQTGGALPEEQFNAIVEAKTEEQIAALIEQNMNSEEVQAQISAALAKAAAGAEAIASLKAQLDSYSQFYYGLAQYTAGVAAAKDGANQLSAGAAQLSSGANQLYEGTARLKAGSDQLVAGSNDLAAGSSELHNGTVTLKESMPALIDGVTALRDGSLELSEGLSEFNEKAVQKIVDAVENDVKELVDRAKATVDAAKSYAAGNGIDNELAGQIKYIYRTDAIEVNAN